ncbi:hypothetical protein [Mucilaginibacter sp.]
MKLNLIRIFVLLFTVIFCYSACKKTATKPVSTSPITDAYSAKQIALSLNQSLSGQLGGANINDGAKAPSSIVAGKKTKTVNSLNPLCGYVIDTAYTHLVLPGDTTEWLSGKFHFVYNCSSSYVDGYTVYDSLKVENYSPTFLDEYTNIQNYTFKATDNTYQSATLNGSIVTSISHQGITPPKIQNQFTSVDCNYQLKGLLITNASGTTDITAGTATFTSAVEEVDGPVGTHGYFANYAGSIQYIGNHQAKLIITGGHTYLINFVTGSVTQQ